MSKRISFDEAEKQAYARSKNIDSKKIYSLAEVASILELKERMVYRYVQRGSLKSVKLSKKGRREVIGQWILDFLFGEEK